MKHFISLSTLYELGNEFEVRKKERKKKKKRPLSYLAEKIAAFQRLCSMDIVSSFVS
jgi:hypothetical protein